MASIQAGFDPFSVEYFDNPYDTYRHMRAEAAVYYSEKYDFYALTRHRDVAAAFKDHEAFSSASGTMLEEVLSGEKAQQSIISMDPPDHRRMRGLVNKVFTPRAIRAQETLVRNTVDRYLAAVDPRKFDVVAEFSALFPVEIITTMLGVPTENRQQIRLWLDTLLERQPGQMAMSEAGMDAALKTAMLYFNLIQERRAEPGDDMISGLIAADIERDDGITRLDDIEIAGFCTLLGGAGAETVTKLVGNAVVHFSRHPGQWRALRSDRSKIPAAIEEVLRYDPPVQYDVRCTRRDVTVGDTTIPAGKAVLLLIGSANRDEEAFPDADRFDIDRDRTVAQNLGFGYGVHSCLGAALARLESSIALDRLLDLMPEFDVDEHALRRVRMTSVAGYSHVPVQVTP
ncbi:cytochrome P450 [Mycolicibacterium palauense]|uniref:cytochrome P450 n=1 Tax=Mycolicibacterium palauense TaxID=2034511 RepID=UPI000BFEC1C0|nr:cytochrome P450 [Mycolicibacterium palauense]